MVFRDAVQEDLKLTDRAEGKGGGTPPGTASGHHAVLPIARWREREEREKKLKAFRQKAQEKLAAVLKETLKEDQSKRLHQLGLQQEGAFALFHGGPEIAKDLKITDEQRKQFMAVVQDMQKKIEPLIKEAQSGGDPRRSGPRHEDPQGTRGQNRGPAHGCPEEAMERDARQAIGLGRVTGSLDNVKSRTDNRLLVLSLGGVS